MPSIDAEELFDENEHKLDYRRANGAPMVSDPEDSTRWLRYSRPSSYADCLDDIQALTSWRIWKAMEGVAKSRALQIQVAATHDDDKEQKEELRNKALDKGQANEKADQGTGLHAMTARVENPDDEWEPPELYEPDLTAYTSCMRRYGLVAEMIEVPFVNDIWRAAGTADRVYRTTKPLVLPTGEEMPVGTLVLGDLKTGQKLDFSLPGYTVQMAIYAQGSLYDLVTQRRMPTPDIDQRWTILVHLPVGKARCELMWCSIEVGNYGAYLAQQVKEWRKKWKSGREWYDELPIPEPIDEPEIPVSEVPLDDLVPEMVVWCIDRIKAIGLHPVARKVLLREWPRELPPPRFLRDERVEPATIITLLGVLERIETEFSIPFPSADPRLAYQTGHRRDMDRSTEFMLAN